MNVWIVWSEITATTIGNGIVCDYDSTQTYINGGYTFEYSIEPSSIFDLTEDVPDLRGLGGDPPNVPQQDSDVMHKGEDLSGGVNLKFDGSRQIRCKMFNPDSIDFEDNHDDPPGGNGRVEDWFTSFLNYPSEPTCGNDDLHVTDPEDNDPYTTPNKDKLTGSDLTFRKPRNTEGDVDNTFEIRLHFRDFARVYLGEKWYKISDNFLWRVHFKCKKYDEEEEEEDINDDGDEEDEVWKNNGSVMAQDNEDWDD